MKVCIQLVEKQICTYRLTILYHFRVENLRANKYGRWMLERNSNDSGVARLSMKLWKPQAD